MPLICLTRYHSNSQTAGGFVFVNSDFIALVEREPSGDVYTRLELAGGTIIKVVEEPRRILHEISHAALEAVS